MCAPFECRAKILRMILIVDDSEDIQVRIRSLLVDRGYADLVVVASAEQARQTLLSGSHLFDLALLDVHLPGEDGISFCRYLRSREDFKDVPILIMTADSSDEVIEETFDSGARDYVRKPLGRAEFLARVEAALVARREALQKARQLHELRALNEGLRGANVNLERKATIDGLTGLANRGYLDYYLDLVWEGARILEKPLSLLMIDVDRFKEYNDTFGHPAGDLVLNQVAAAIDSNLIHPGYLAARYGGEEFCIVLPATNQKAAVRLAERMRASVENLSMEHTASNAVTVSVGVATRLPVAEEMPAVIVEQADRALYAAKHAGRNRVCVGS